MKEIKADILKTMGEIEKIVSVHIIKRTPNTDSFFPMPISYVPENDNNLEALLKHYQSRLNILKGELLSQYEIPTKKEVLEFHSIKQTL